MQYLRLTFDAQFCGNMTKVIQVPLDINIHEIKNLFFIEFGIPYDNNCSWEFLECIPTNSIKGA